MHWAGPIIDGGVTRWSFWTHGIIRKQDRIWILVSGNQTLFSLCFLAHLMFPIICFSSESSFSHLLSDSASVYHPDEILFLSGDGQEAVPSPLVNTIRDHKCTVGRLRTPADDDTDGLLSSHQLSVSRSCSAAMVPKLQQPSELQISGS